MNRNTSRHDAAVETFHEYGGLTQRESEAFVYRELAGLTRGDAAVHMDIGESTLDTLHQRAKQKARLPNIDVVKRQSPRNTGSREGVAYEVWLENGALIRYVWDNEYGEIMEQTQLPTDPHSIYHDAPVGGDGAHEVAEYMLETLEEYTRTYRDDWAACRKDWPPIFESIVGFE